MISFFTSQKQSLRKTVTPTAGFSLIEVLVSLSIFTVVVTISVGSLMMLVEANARTRSIHAAMTNLSFTLDSMTREIRTGTDYYCVNSGLPESGFATNDCGVTEYTKASAMAFNEGGQSLTSAASSRRIGYRLNNSQIERKLGDGSWVSLTDPNITIVNLNFYIWGSDPESVGDIKAPIVTIYVSGYATNRGPSEKFDIQTSVTQLLLDI